MKSAFIPRTLIILSIIVVAVTFLAGVLHAFDSARAASSKATAIASHPAEIELTPTPAPTPVPISGDTIGIISLAMVIVIIVLVGAVLGAKKPYRKKTSQ
jgi:hypothetical protein